MTNPELIKTTNEILHDKQDCLSIFDKWYPLSEVEKLEKENQDIQNKLNQVIDSHNGIKGNLEAYKKENQELKDKLNIEKNVSEYNRKENQELKGMKDIWIANNICLKQEINTIQDKIKQIENINKTNLIEKDIQEQIKQFDNIQGIKANNKATYFLVFPNHIVDVKAIITIKRKNNLG